MYDGCYLSVYLITTDYLIVKCSKITQTWCVGIDFEVIEFLYNFPVFVSVMGMVLNHNFTGLPKSQNV